MLKPVTSEKGDFHKEDDVFIFKSKITAKLIQTNAIKFYFDSITTDFQVEFGLKSETSL